jgi:hypothetical protein
MTKPGAENIRLVRADFRRARLEGVFGAVIVGPANLSRLRTLRAQFELLATAANHITANGIVIVETMTGPGEPPSGAAPTRQPGIGLRFPALPELDLMADNHGTPATEQGSRLRRHPIRRTVPQGGHRIPLWTVVIAANSDGNLTGARRVVCRSPLAK